MLTERRKMPGKKKAKVICPAPDCQGGYPNREHEVDEKIIEKIPFEILDRLDDDEKPFRCNCCGFVYGKSFSKQGGIRIKPLGFLDSPQNPNEFVPVSKNYRTRYNCFNGY